MCEQYFDSCRICFSHGAQLPIFEYDENNIYQKLSSCLQEKVEDIAGYPRYICSECNYKLNVAFDFINSYKETCKFLKGAIANVKKEELSEISGNDENYDKCEDRTDELEIKLEVDPFDCVVENSTTAQISETVLTTNSTHQQKCNSKKPMTSMINLVKATKTQNPCTPKTNHERVTPVAESILEKVLTWNGGKWSTPKEPNKIMPRNQEFGIPIQKKLVCQDPATFNNGQNKDKTDIIAKKLCHLCGDLFLNEDSLGRHIDRVHCLKKSNCPQCRSSFSRPDLLANHIKRIHGPRNYSCNECGKNFAFSPELNNHIKRIHRKIKRSKTKYACSLCDKTFASKLNVKMHEGTHSGKRPEVCSVCGKDFTHALYLREHMRLHTGETPYKCPVCGRGYAQRCNMKSHIKHNHSISELDDDTKSRIKPNYLRLMKP